jgi:hypothetical protein
MQASKQAGRQPRDIAIITTKTIYNNKDNGKMLKLKKPSSKSNTQRVSERKKN